jgi:hypothetical protein
MGIFYNLRSKVANAIAKVKASVVDVINNFNEKQEPLVDKGRWKISLMGQLLNPYLSGWYLRRKVGKEKRADVPMHIHAQKIEAAQLKRERKAAKRARDDYMQQRNYYPTDAYYCYWDIA